MSTGAAIGPILPPAAGQFVEGLTALPDGRLLQLTYREGQVNEYRAVGSALERVSTVPVSLGAEGWGLTHSADGATLYATDSTDLLLHVNATTLQVEKSVRIVDGRLGDAVRAIYGVNELERVGDEVWGNVYPSCALGSSGRRAPCMHSECVARLDPATGRVLGWVDMSALLALESAAVRADALNNVLNGLAYRGGDLYVTGKNWRSIYRVALEPTALGPEHVERVCNLQRRE